MGMYDTVYLNCPECGVHTGIQSKAGRRTLASYSLAEAPAAILIDLSRRTEYCPNGHPFYLKTQAIIHTVPVKGPHPDGEDD